ncbi:MAG: RidA family protein [Parcubacteria group bacterium]|nr:RidA family protein [Parcubacteria group bacterium]
MKKIYKTDKAPEAIGPYSQMVQVGNTYYLSGQIPLKPDGILVEGSIEEQVGQVMENIKAVLESAGLGMEDIVKATIYLTDLNNFEKVNEVYGSYFEKDPPARSTVRVAGLPKGAKVEIEAVAIKKI